MPAISSGCGARVELLPSCPPAPMPIHIVYPAGRLLPGLEALRHRGAASRR
jgi:hypothetical protein